MRKGMAVSAAAFVLLVAVVGCGGDSSSLSKAEYEQQLELVCNKGLQERGELVSAVNREFEQREGKTSPKYEAENLTKLATVYEGTTEAIDELGLPDQEPEKIEELIQAREKASARVLADPLSARGNLEPIFEEANEHAESLGVKSCAM